VCKKESALGGFTNEFFFRFTDEFFRLGLRVSFSFRFTNEIFCLGLRVSFFV
jgi:hypothetical protein